MQNILFFIGITTATIATQIAFEGSANVIAQSDPITTIVELSGESPKTDEKSLVVNAYTCCDVIEVEIEEDEEIEVIKLFVNDGEDEDSIAWFINDGDKSISLSIFDLNPIHKRYIIKVGNDSFSSSVISLKYIEEDSWPACPWDGVFKGQKWVNHFEANLTAIRCAHDLRVFEDREEQTDSNLLFDLVNADTTTLVNEKTTTPTQTTIKPTTTTDAIDSEDPVILLPGERGPLNDSEEDIDKNSIVGSEPFGADDETSDDDESDIEGLVVNKIEKEKVIVNYNDIGSVSHKCEITEMGLIIPKSYFADRRINDWGHLYMYGLTNHTSKPSDIPETCEPIEVGDDVVFMIKDDILNCGTEAKLDTDASSIIYYNQIQGTVGESNGVISRKRNFNMAFSCQLPSSVAVSLPHGITVTLQHIDLEKETNPIDIDVEIDLYNDNDFTQKLTPNSIVRVPHPIHVAFLIPENSQNTRSTLKVQLRDCWVTPTANPIDSVFYLFLENYCDLTDGWGHELYSNGYGLTSFSLETFQWNMDVENGESCSELYLHCDVRICDQNEESCEKTCARRKRRFALETRTVTAKYSVCKESED